ncbi:cupin domain-containing protein [Sorangium sp. So ce1128]
MDPRFDNIFTRPENSIFKVVFFPDRIYHAQYLNATRSPRYRYNIHEVRSKLDITVLKGDVFLDGRRLTSVVRIEYRASRLVEQVRARGRLVGGTIAAWTRFLLKSGESAGEAVVKLHPCRFTDSYQVELWETLEPPPGQRHDISVLDQMGQGGPITRVRTLSPALRDIKALKRVQLAFREDGPGLPISAPIDDPEWDNNYLSSHEEPRVNEPSSGQNTVSDKNYELDFQRGWSLQADNVQPVRYRNAMMDAGNPDIHPDNVIEMRWLLQRELGGSVVFFHEVTIPPGKVEGTHYHIGSEELYYIVAGQGIAYLGAGDDPATEPLPTVERDVFGLGKVSCKELPVRPGSVLFTKSGGVHGIRNSGREPLKFVAFLYQST